MVTVSINPIKYFIIKAHSITNHMNEIIKTNVFTVTNNTKARKIENSKFTGPSNSPFPRGGHS